ncbi:MAG TPA: hypothetical protein PKN45_06685 [Candidatus Limiplasma sp.]|nr:hypothetical protein [Candidatus Limiplasma sp.]HPR77647.1 hypothetical protein [Candidatus Limiplasma sp.]
MRILKTAMYLMITLVVLALGVVGYFFATAKVTITAYDAKGAQATQNQALFDQLKDDVAQNTLQGTLFKTATLGNATDYAFITYTVRLSNQCLVPIDMVEIQVEPDPEDVLQMGDTAVRSLNARSVGDITATILTAKDKDAVREVIVSYYVWGVSFTIRQTIGG